MNLAIKAALMTALLAGLGCGGQPAPVAAPTAKKTEVAAATRDHGGWWCDEHGVKEAECSMCNAKVAKAYQAKGDWCAEHNRAQSQCFVCDPKLEQKFAAEYVAKYGEQPPEPAAQRVGKE